MTATPEGRPSDLRLLGRLAPWVRPHRRLLFAAAAMLPVMAASAMAQPWLLGVAVDEYMHAGRTDGLWPLASVYLVLVVAEYLATAFHGWLLSLAGARVIAALRISVLEHILAQGHAFHDRRAAGVLLSRTTSDVEAIGESFVTGVISIVADVVRLLGIVAIMLVLSPHLTLASFAALPAFWLVVNFFRRRVRDTGLAIRAVVAKMNGFMSEHLAGVEVVQLFGREEAAAREFQDVAKGALQIFHRNNVYDAALYAVMDGLGGVAVGLLVWYASGDVLAGLATPGLVVSFVDYVQRALVPIKEFSAKYATLQHSFAGMDRVFGLLDTHEAVPEGDLLLAHPRGEVLFDDVRFAYSVTHPVLAGVTLRAAPGEVVAIVGSSGSGKSTLCRLLTRGYTGHTGTISVDGVPVESLQRRELARIVATVPQDVVLLRGSIRFNVTLGDPAITDDAIWQALGEVQAAEFVQALGGLDAQLGERGAGLSAGQGQLLTFARALARRPAVVVLDEATASVDPGTESLIQDALASVFRGRTVLVVAHRLSTIRAADRIVVLEAGRVVEEGSHDRLLNAGGRYAELLAAAKSLSTAA